MKKKKILFVLASLTALTSCNEDTNKESVIDSESLSEFKSDEFSESSNESENESLDELLQGMLISTPSESYEKYSKALVLCQELYDEYNTQTYKTIKDSGGKSSSWHTKSSTLYTTYWESHTKLMKALKQVLQDSDKYDYYNARMENCEFYKNLDENNFNVERSIKDINLDELNTLGETIQNDLEEGTISKEDLASKIEEYDATFGDLLNDKYLSSLNADIFADNEELQDASALYDEKYNDVVNTYKAIFKAALTNDNYKDYIYTYFELTEEDYEYFINVEINDDETMALLNEETNLVSSFEKAYNAQDEDFDYGTNYLNLVNVRNKIAQKKGYDNYYEYAFEEVYSRDYTVKEASNLTSNILASDELNDANDALYETIMTLYTSLMTSYVKESNLMEWLTYCENIEPRAKQALLELETYGNYNFEYRTNKYGGSYVTTIDTDSNKFILISRNGNVFDYSTTAHEFGHYIALTQSDPELEGDTYSLDICEVHSQGMEYLMTNYYQQILQKRKGSSKGTIQEQTQLKQYANALTSYEIYNAIWTLQSGSAIAAFEEYAYTTTDTLTTTKLQEKSDELLGVLGSYNYYDIPHIFSSPAYYISYVTSLIAALEIYSLDFDEAIKAYQTVVSYGETNSFKYVLEKASLKDPFTDVAWNTILNKIETVAGTNK